MNTNESKPCDECGGKILNLPGANMCPACWDVVYAMGGFRKMASIDCGEIQLWWQDSAGSPVKEIVWPWADDFFATEEFLESEGFKVEQV
jgi:hypothetical protein